ncbi:MAG: hypothetical protein ABL878_06400 [Burkholderiales bacterium]
MKSKLMLGAIACLLFMSGPVLAQDAPVMRVIVVQSENPGAYIKEVLETGRAHLKRVDSAGNLRIWRTKFAGSDAGNVIIAIEYPSLTTLAADDKKLATDPALSAWVRSLDKMRKIVSDSLYSEAR